MTQSERPRQGHGVIDGAGQKAGLIGVVEIGADAPPELRQLPIAGLVPVGSRAPAQHHEIGCGDGSLRERLNETVVIFKRLSREEIDAYLASGEWEGKAGGYAIQGIAEGLIRRIQGSHSGVVGLPLYETRILLKSAGFDIA